MTTTELLEYLHEYQTTHKLAEELARLCATRWPRRPRPPHDAPRRRAPHRKLSRPAEELHDSGLAGRAVDTAYLDTRIVAG